MYRDPSEFRERFKAYKDGKSVREIYGLPGYAGGKSSSAVDDTADFLRLYEGFKEKTYLDGKGIPTIGYGFTDAKFVNKGRITRAEAEAELKRQIAVRLAELRRKLGPQVWDSLSNDSKKALTSYHFNYPAGFKDNTKFMLYWRAGRYSDAIKEVDAGWNDPDNPGLRTRRIAELKLLRSDPALFSRPIPEKPSDVTILRPDILRVANIIPQEKTIPIADPRNATIAEALRAMWAHTSFENMPKISDMPIWESPSLPALTPVEYDVTPFKYKDGKLPGYQWGKAKEIQQGRKLIPIDKAEAATEPDYNEGWFLTTIKRGVNNAIKTVKDQVRAARNIVNGRGSLGDYVELGVGAALGAGGKLLKGASKEAKQVAKRTLKPTKASTEKFNTRDPNKVGAYYSAHPEEITPMVDNPEVKEVVNFMNNHTGPKYAKQNGVHIGIDPSDINIGYADLSGSNLGGYVGPSGEVVINKDILNNRDLLRYVLGHEIAGHWFDLHYPLTVPQMSTVGYGMPFKQDFLAERPWFNAIKEANAERRAFLLMTYFDKGVLGEDLDEAIKHMAKAEAKRYIDRLGYARGIDWQWPDILPFKQAATSVPAAGAGIYLAGNEEYKNGKLPGYFEGELPMGEKRLLTDEEVKLAAQNASHEQGMSGEDPLMSTLVGMKAIRLVGDLLAERRLKEKAETYKRWREANELTRDASRAWKMQDADRMARNWGYSDNPLGFLYDIFLDPIANMYTKIQKHPILGPLIPFSDGKLPGYSNGKIRIKPANRGKFNATKKRTGKTTEELTHSKNPLTRKRAIFAQNAKKWNHK